MSQFQVLEIHKEETRMSDKVKQVKIAALILVHLENPAVQLQQLLLLLLLLNQLLE